MKFVSVLWFDLGFEVIVVVVAVVVVVEIVL
jgi:hypothetical protein